MRISRPIHCLLLTLLLLVAGCNDGGTGSSDVEPPVADVGSTPSVDSDSSSTSDGTVEIEQPETGTPAEPSSESDLLVDDVALSPSAESDDESVSVQTFELSLNQASASLDEGSRDGTTIDIEVSPGGDESIELIVEPENPIDGQGIEISLNRQRLDSENRSTTVTFTMPVDMRPRQEHQRTFIVRATSGEETQSLAVTLSIQPFNAPDVYLLIGQSNMVGSSEEGAKQLTSGGADEQDSRIWQLNVTHNDIDLFTRPSDYSRDDRISVEPRFVQAQDPLHEPLRADRDEKGGTKVGSGMSFARAASRDTTQQIYLVPAAWGGSGFCDQLSYDLAWNAYTSNNRALGGNGLLDRAIARLNLTLQDTGGVFRGILWHQGEADSGSSACAESYAQNITRMVERIRIEVTEDARGGSARGPQAPIPFVLGTMSKGQDSRGDFSRWSETKEQVDSVHRQISELVPYANWVNNDDLVPPAYPCGSGSCVHFGSLAIREMGQRYYQALVQVWDSQ